MDESEDDILWLEADTDVVISCISDCCSDYMTNKRFMALDLEELYSSTDDDLWTLRGFSYCIAKFIYLFNFCCLPVNINTIGVLYADLNYVFLPFGCKFIVSFKVLFARMLCNIRFFVDKKFLPCDVFSFIGI